MTEGPAEQELIVHIPEKYPLRAIAIVEVGKGLVAVLFGSGFAFPVQTAILLRRLAKHLHFDPANDKPGSLIDLITTGASAHAKLLAAGALFYALVRFAEALGLWYDKRWASWVGFLGAAAYLPYEIVHMIGRPSWLTFGFIVVTGGAVAFLAYHLRLRLKRA
jgi:uncharacterized membrane protein (DUF2068 family)